MSKKSCNYDNKRNILMTSNREETERENDMDQNCGICEENHDEAFMSYTKQVYDPNSQADQAAPLVVRLSQKE